jgi:hypothetical protein
MLQMTAGKDCSVFIRIIAHRTCKFSPEMCESVITRETKRTSFSFSPHLSPPPPLPCSSYPSSMFFISPLLLLLLYMHCSCVCFLLLFDSGTFSKRSRVVSGRRPFARDSIIMNYDYDSEAEWEEEDPEGVCVLSTG